MEGGLYCETPRLGATGQPEALCTAMKEFFENVFRYPRYLISFTLGILYNFLQPLAALLQRPATAVALVGAVVAGFLFLTFTLRAMLGLNAV
jgi:membrane protein insertase Oxa1/YidC/SpoIIIJ